MEEEVAEENHMSDDILQSPRSPVQSSYGGSDAGDETADQDTKMNGKESTSDMEEPNDDVDENEDEEEDNDDDEKEAHSTVDEDSNTGNSLQDNGATESIATIEQSELANDPPQEEKKRFKYKYPEAYPTPPGWDDETWNKAYTAADSRIYNHAKKNHQVSKQKRGEGVTRIEALQWEADRGKREAKKASRKPGLKQQQQQTSHREASSSTVTASVPTDADMGNKKNQKKKSAASTPVASSSSQQHNLSQTQSPEALPTFATLADRVKGKSAASAAASSPFTAESSTPLRAESEKVLPPKKGVAVPAKKVPNAKSDTLSPMPKLPTVPKSVASKPRTSKSGTPASAANNSQQYSELEQFSDHEGEDDGNNELFCVCDTVASTNMIACDNCLKWFHRRASCLGEDDAAIYRIHESNIDKWYCPICKAENPSLKMTWYRMCRRTGCDKPALVNNDPPSKYCSEFCGVEFFREKMVQASPGSEPSMGGALTRAELGKALGSVKSAAEFKQLGKSAPKFRATGQVVSKQFLRDMVTNGTTDGENVGKVYGNRAEYKEMAAEDNFNRRLAGASARAFDNLFNQAPTGPPLTPKEFLEGAATALGGGGDITSKNFLDVDYGFLQRHGMINSSEAETIHDLQAMMEYNAGWIKVAELKVNFIKAIRDHSAKILRAKGLEPKIICGYLAAISKSDHDFRKWSETEEGAQICVTAKIDSLEPSQAEKWRKGSEAAICLHSVKKHPAHFNWADTHEKENIRRKLQLAEEMASKLKQLNELLTVVHYRLADGDWKPIL